MGTAKLLLGAGALLMASAIVYALTVGRLVSEAGVLFAYPWFHVSLIDLYVGFLLFAGWVAFREKKRAVAVAWIVSILLLGNLAACVYALIAVHGARGDWRAFWLGSSGMPSRT